jgi:hypothetical protein
MKRRRACPTWNQKRKAHEFRQIENRNELTNRSGRRLANNDKERSLLNRGQKNHPTLHLRTQKSHKKRKEKSKTGWPIITSVVTYAGLNSIDSISPAHETHEHRGGLAAAMPTRHQRSRVSLSPSTREKRKSRAERSCHHSGTLR